MAALKVTLGFFVWLFRAVLPPFWTNCGGSGTGLAWTMNYWTPFR